MADAPRQPPADLSETLGAPPGEMELMALLRALECGPALFGVAATPDAEPARIGQEVRQTFATRDVARLEQRAEGLPPLVRQQVFGLLGPDGPMPLTLTRWTLDRLSQRWYAADTQGVAADTTFVDFCDMLQHRMTGLFYRAWADARLEVQNDRGGEGRADRVFRALVGTGLPGRRAPDAVPEAVRLRQAGALAQQAAGPERAARLVAGVVDAPVRLIEFVGTMLEIPRRLQSRLGRAQGHAALGRSAVAGARSFQRAYRVELRIGALSLARFRDLLPGGACHRALVDALRYALSEVPIADVRLVLRAREVPPARLNGEGQLGRTLWLARDTGAPDADDLCLRGLTGAPREAAA